MNRNIRNTNQRSVILSNVLSRKDHPSADDIYLSIHEKYPTISRGTVYRNLKLLADQGKILHISVPNTADRFDSTLNKHYHFVCEVCKKVYDIDVPYMKSLDKQINNIDGFLIKDYDLVFKGICPECRKK